MHIYEQFLWLTIHTRKKCELHVFVLGLSQGLKRTLQMGWGSGQREMNFVIKARVKTQM